MKNLDLNIFPKIDKNQWLKLAEKQLKGADPSSELSWKNDAGLELNAYYDKSDAQELKYLEDFFSKVDPHKWKLYERIVTEDSKHANKQALEALMGGCDGVIFENPNPNELDVVLQDVNHEICDISVIADGNIDSTRFNGFRLHTNGNCVAIGEKHNPIEQVFELVNDRIKETHIYRIAFTDFFLEVATVRALRYLLEQRAIKDIHIHTHVPLHNSEEHQWFLNTTSGLASILGGSHSINLPTATGNSRISRNTGNLIREESGIDEYNDQCGGSHYVEVLTDKIIKKVSEKLKQ